MTDSILMQIPARAGSQRVPSKNLRLLNGKPLISYSVDAAKASRHSLEIYINSEAEVFRDLAGELGVNFHKRPDEYATHTATGDDFTWEFIQARQPKILGMVNPVCPFVRPATIDRAVDAFLNSNCDTLISCSETQMQGFFRGDGINLDPSQALRPSQENEPVQILNWAITLWDAAAFAENYQKNQSGYLGSDRLLFPISPLEAIKISTEDEFRLCEAISSADSAAPEPKYWSPA